MSRVRDYSTWIVSKQAELEGTIYGTNKHAVRESLNSHRNLLSEVEDVERELAKTTLHESEDLKNSHKNLLELVVKQHRCIETLLELQSIEEAFGDLTNDIAHKSVALTEKFRQGTPADYSKSVGPSGVSVYQSCILSLKLNWEWLSTLMKCSDVHLKDAGNYQQFYHTIYEYSHWMPVDLEKVKVLLDVVQIKDNTHGTTIARLLQEIKTALSIFLRWRARADALLHQARDLAPMHLRTSRVGQMRPAFSLADYSTNHFRLLNGEEVTLLDNSRSQMWRVKNLQGEECEVPSVILKIPGPDEESLDKVMRIALELLASWTNMVKRYGKTIILFLLHVIRIWTPSEEMLLANLSQREKQEVRKLLDIIEKTFMSHWMMYPPYKELERRILNTRELLDRPASNDSSKGYGSLLVVQTHLLEDLLYNYQEFWKNWETFKVLTERIKHPECLLSVSDWKQYHFLQLSDWLKIWQVSLDLDDSDYDQYGRSLMEEQIQVERSKQLAVTSQIFSSEQEENQTFIITGVTDPETLEQISLDQAVSRGIVNQMQGTYITNKKTRASIPIPVAMNSGKIKVELVTVKKSQERVKDMGLINIKMIKETRPYILKGVRNTKGYGIISIDEAAKLGILNQKANHYKDPLTGNILSLADALDSGLLIVDFLSDADSYSEPSIESKTYVVSAVMDRKTERSFTFSEAVRAGLINPDNGSYYDSLRMVDIYIGDAIREGFVKAIVSKDTAFVDVDPSNKISISEDKLYLFRRSSIDLN